MKRRMLPVLSNANLPKSFACLFLFTGLLMFFSSTLAGTYKPDSGIFGEGENYVSNKHFIGEKFGGGIVFYVDDKGEHGLVVSLVDLKKNAKWGYLDSAVNAHAEVVGSGKANTLKICNLIKEQNIAARLSSNYAVGKFKDWYLPSKDELNLIYINLKKQQLGELADGMYWSSTETDFNNAWAQIFETGFAIERHVNTPCHVRAIRAF